MSDRRLRAGERTVRRLRELRCSTPGHGDRKGAWLVPREDGRGSRWVCDGCRRSGADDDA